MLFLSFLGINPSMIPLNLKSFDKCSQIVAFSNNWYLTLLCLLIFYRVKNQMFDTNTSVMLGNFKSWIKWKNFMKYNGVQDAMNVKHGYSLPILKKCANRWILLSTNYLLFPYWEILNLFYREKYLYIHNHAHIKW